MVLSVARQNRGVPISPYGARLNARPPSAGLVRLSITAQPAGTNRNTASNTNAGATNRYAHQSTSRLAGGMKIMSSCMGNHLEPPCGVSFDRCPTANNTRKNTPTARNAMASCSVFSTWPSDL